MKINEVDKVTTLAPAEYITAIAADGSLIQIPVEELGKVLAQVIPVATREKNGLMGTDGFFSSSSTCSDANSAINSGTYLTSNVTINAGRSAWGTLIVFKSYYTVQLQIITASVPEFYFRMFAGDGWIKWRKISFT